MEHQKNMIVGLVQQYNANALRIADLEKQLKECKANNIRITMDDIPALMMEAGVSQLTTDDGTKVTVKSDFSCGMPSETAMKKAEPMERQMMEEMRDSCIKYLRANGADIIKTNMMIDIGKMRNCDNSWKLCCRNFQTNCQPLAKVHLPLE